MSSTIEMTNANNVTVETERASGTEEDVTQTEEDFSIADDDDNDSRVEDDQKTQGTRREKTCSLGFRPGQILTSLCTEVKKRPEAWRFGHRNLKKYAIQVAKIRR